MPNPTWLQRTPVLSNQVLELQRGNSCEYQYRLPSGPFPAGIVAQLALYDTSGNPVDAWLGVVLDDRITFFQPPAVADAIPAGTSWTLTVLYPGADGVTMLAQGTVVRNEAPFPGQSPTNVLDAVQYSYTFATPGNLADVAWNVLTGTPVVYNNSSLSLPNAVAAGSPDVLFLDGGANATTVTSTGPWSQVEMLYYAPLPSDAVSMSYNVVNGAGSLGGRTYIVISSAYDMSSCVAFYHDQFNETGVPTVGIATGSGPITGTTYTQWDIQESTPYTTNVNDNFIAQYNPATNTYALFLFGNTTPLVTWTDDANLIPHGPGYRYVGFHFISGALGPGVEIADWLINPNTIYSAAEYDSNTYTADATAVVPSWANTIELIGIGGGGGGNGEDLISVGFGGSAGAWNATSLTVGATGAAGIKAGSTITITVGKGGAGGAYFTVGNPGTATTFSWVDAAGTAQSLSCPGGLGGVTNGNPLTWGLSPGNLTFDGKTYDGGGMDLGLGTGGLAPGGGGAGGQPFQFGWGGGNGQAWVVATQTSTTLNPPQSQTFTANASYTPQPWAVEVDLIGIGGGSGGNGDQSSGLVSGIGGAAGAWAATTLKVGTNGATGLKAGTAITVTVGAGGTGGPYLAAGYPGHATVFSWVDAAGVAQTLSCPGGPGSAGNTNITSWGLSPGNLTYENVQYTGGPTAVTAGTNGVAPGGGGPGGVIGVASGNGMPGGNGQAWIVDRQS